MAYCDDPSLIGTPFYLMERLRGRIFVDPLLPEVPREERRAICLYMAETLGAFHKALALCRLAVISAGIVARAKAGIASNARAVEVGARSRQIAEQGWRIAQRG